MPPLSTLPAIAQPPLSRTRLCAWTAAALIIIFGILIRIVPWTGFTTAGFDEVLYRSYVLTLDRGGLASYPIVCQLYLEDQKEPGAITKLPPTRFLYIYCGWIAKRILFGDAPPVYAKAPNFAQTDPALLALHRTASVFSSLLFIVAGICAWRMLGTASGLGVLALAACSPTQIHLAQHAFVDGFLAFWATMCVWLLWENLRTPNHRGWLAALGACLALMVLTKENAFFVYIGLCGLVGINRWARFGEVTRGLLLIMVAGPLAGLSVLMNLAGGTDVFIAIYQLLVSNAEKLTYAIRTGDGPWHRYFVDLMIVSPVVLCLAIGGLFTSVKTSRPLLYLSAFVGFTYVVMCNIKFGMNLRYATIWELPICALATAQVCELARPFGKRASFVAILLVIGLCAYSLRQYVIFFVDNHLYELISEALLRAVKIVKP